jgi:hypothetical protein
MAYVYQTDKKELAVDIKKVLNKHGVKATIGVRRHSTLTVKIKSGPIDFGKIDNYFGLNVNVYHINNHYTGVAREFLNELHVAMRGPKWFADMLSIGLIPCPPVQSIWRKIKFDFFFII